MTAPSPGRRPRRPDVALFMPTLGGGGAERVMVDLAGAFAELDYAVEVVVASAASERAVRLPDGVRLVDLGGRRVATAFVPLALYLRRQRPKTLLSTLEHANVAALLARRASPDTRVVVREANTVGDAMVSDDAIPAPLLWAMRQTYRHADAAVAVSAGVAVALTTSLGVPRERVAMILNPVITPRVWEGAKRAPEHRWFAPGEPPVVLGVGRLAPQKRFDTLIRAFAEVRQRMPCRLVILGEGALRVDLAALALELGVDGDVDMPGFVDNPFSYMARAGTFVLSSAYEGLPNALIQALALGTPVVATDCPSGPKEILEEGHLGELVAVGDERGMADAIVRSLACPHREPPREWYERYRLETVAGRYLEVLGLAADGASPRARVAADAGRPLRVLLVTTSMSAGGAERQVYLLARGLRRRGHDVAVASMVEPEHYVSELAGQGVSVTGLGMAGGVPDPRGLGRLARLVRRWQPDVVHSHMVHANLLARVARLFAPMPVQISTAHSLNEGARWRMVAYRLTDPLATLTTNVCRACVERYVRLGAVPSGKARYIPNGIELTQPAAGPAARRRLREQLGVGDAFVWLAVGRMDAAKDYPTMVRALARLPQDRPFVVLVAGGGPGRAAVEALAVELGLPDATLRLLGHRSDVPELLSAADGFLMSSVVEGLSLALMEAAATRLPAVATDVGGNPEVVLPGTNGLLVPARDPEALATAMAQVMSMTPEALRAWGDAAREHVAATFEIGRIVERWERLYRELLGPAARVVLEGGRP